MFVGINNNIVFHKLISSVPVIAAWQSDINLINTGSGLAGEDGTHVGSWIPTMETSGSWTLFPSGTVSVSGSPTITQRDLNGYPSITFNGTDQMLWSGLNNKFNTPGLNVRPFSVPYYSWGVCKQISWTSADRLWRLLLASARQFTASPQIQQAVIAGGLNNSAGTIGTWFRMEEYHKGDTTNFLKIGSTNVTGTNTDGTAVQLPDSHSPMCLGGLEVTGTSSNLAWVACLCTQGLPSTAERTALDAAVRRKYGTSVLV